jgi:hypothetical protein
VEVGEGPYGLLELTVPPGAADVHLEYDIPGLRPGLVALTLGLLVALGHQLLWRRARRATVPPASSARVTLPSHESVSAPPRAEAHRPTT